ncbi:MAG: META domain-containing protein [Gammaproteobacteria bacterium]
MKARIAILALCLLSSACQSGPQQVQGLYSFGHEVNVVCVGDPKSCYWLVDTSAEIRQKLKQQVADKPPYTEVCLNLIAELFAKKADGFGQDYDGSIRVQQMLGTCDDRGVISITSLTDLQHRRWVLDRINDLELMDYAGQLGFELTTAPELLPELDFGEQGFLSGNTGCNRFKGQASVADNQLTLGPLASTRMACPGFAGELELQLQMFYSNSLTITRQAGFLFLQSGENILKFKLRDWVQ